MLMFLLGFIVGGILGIIFMAVLVMGSIADRIIAHKKDNLTDISQFSKQLYNLILQTIRSKILLIKFMVKSLVFCDSIYIFSINMPFILNLRFSLLRANQGKPWGAEQRD
jgi:hypothetical protein